MTGAPTFAGPDRAAHVLRDLFGKAVTAKKGAPLPPAAKGFRATYVDDTGKAVCACLCDLPLAASMGSALALIPAGVAGEAIRKGQLPEEMLENFREVLNIMASLFEGAHVRFRDAVPTSATLPKDGVAIVARPSLRVDLDLTLAGYPGGKLGFMVA